MLYILYMIADKMFECHGLVFEKFKLIKQGHMVGDLKWLSCATLHC